jgi:hypothetical protein
LSDEEFRMDLLSPIWWGSAVGGFASIAVAMTMPSRRRAALLMASLLFLVAGVLGILSIGIIFIVAAIVCAVAAGRSARTDAGGRALTAD